MLCCLSIYDSIPFFIVQDNRAITFYEFLDFDIGGFRYLADCACRRGRNKYRLHRLVGAGRGTQALPHFEMTRLYEKTDTFDQGNFALSKLPPQGTIDASEKTHFVHFFEHSFKLQWLVRETV